MAPPLPHYESQKAMQRSLPHSGIRVHDHPNISIGTNRFHGMLQGCRAERKGTITQLERGRGGKALPILQQGYPSGKLRATKLREESVEVTLGRTASCHGNYRHHGSL